MVQQVHLTASVRKSTLNRPFIFTIRDRLDIELVNAPLAARFFPAADRWLQEQKAKAAGREVERVQQQGVKPNL